MPKYVYIVRLSFKSEYEQNEIEDIILSLLNCPDVNCPNNKLTENVLYECKLTSLVQHKYDNIKTAR